MTIMETGIALAIISALSQAVAHGIWKSGRDKLAVRALIGIVEATVAFPFLFLVQLPERGVWLWLAFSVGIHAVYQLVTISAYKAADFSIAFPLARGVAPILTTFMAWFIFSEQLSLGQITGVLFLCLGLLLLAFRGRAQIEGTLWALAAGVLVTIYTVVDAAGLRVAKTAFTFIAWFFVMEGIFMTSIFVALRGKRSIELLKGEGLRGVLGGGVSVVGFGAALWAFRQSLLGPVAALRETSVMFAGLYAKFVLKETLTRIQVLSYALMTFGAILVAVK